MEPEITICIPGTWEDRNKLIESIVVSTKGEFMLAGMILAHPAGNDHVELEIYEPFDQMTRAFEYGGQGKISSETLSKLENHRSVVYLHFSGDIVSQKERIVKFTEMLSRCGGIAVKLESCGVSHEWDRWFNLLRSDDLFDTYCASVVLVGDEQSYYSCGMHNFGLPDTQISNRFDPAEGAELINKFNFWQLGERPTLEVGHTFSLTENSPQFRLWRAKDIRHPEDDLFFNPNGLWELRHDSGH